MWDLIRANKRKTVFLIFSLLGLFISVGYFSGELIVPGAGPFGIAAGLLIWILMFLLSRYVGKPLIMLAHGAKKVKRTDNPKLINLVEEMCIASGLRTYPEVYLIDDPALNAFATGWSPEESAVAVTTGLLEQLDRTELQGVIAHEIAHINNRDTLVMLVSGIMAGVIAILSDFAIRVFIYSPRSRRSSGGGGQLQAIIFIVGIFLMILSPIISELIYLAISRKREYLADACACQYTRYPNGLGRALEKIANRSYIASTSRPLAPMYISMPASGKNKLHTLFSTHPPIEERIKILRTMAGPDLESYAASYQRITSKNLSIGSDPASVPAGSAAPTIPEEPEPEPVEKRRDTGNTLWRLNNYLFDECECGAVLKVPPDFPDKEFPCPRCGKPHTTR